MDDAKLVPSGSAVHQEFARLHHLARSLRPTAVDRWNGELYATDAEVWGGFDPKSGAIYLSESRVLRHLTGSTSADRLLPRRRSDRLLPRWQTDLVAPVHRRFRVPLGPRRAAPDLLTATATDEGLYK